jgi:hypothetical protein
LAGQRYGHNSPAENPYDLAVASSTLNTGTSQRPNRIGSGGLGNSSINEHFDLARFTIPAPFTFWNAGRNILRGPGLHTFDISGIKDVKFGERYRLSVSQRFLQYFQRAAVQSPGNTIGTPQAGVISSTRFATNRQIHFVLKLFF